MIVALLLMAAAPSAEAEALGARLARTGTLAALLPLMEAKETEELVAQHPELSAEDQATLRATAKDVADRGADRLLAAEGKAYAAALSIADLQVLVAAAESEADARRAAGRDRGNDEGGGWIRLQEGRAGRILREDGQGLRAEEIAGRPPSRFVNRNKVNAAARMTGASRN